MKPTQTLAETQEQFLGAIRALAEHMILYDDSQRRGSDNGTFAKAQRNFSKALRSYAEALVYDAYSRYDPYDGGEFLTREAYEELMEALADDEVIPMEEIAEEFGIKW